MPRKCSVLECSSFKKKPHVTLFKVPSTDFYSWNAVIRKVNGNNIKKVNFVCAEHFAEEDLLKTYNGPKDLEKVGILDSE